MGTFLIFFLGLIVVSGLMFLLASFVFGRGEELAAMPADATPTELPDDRPTVGNDLRALRFVVSFRGYRMSDVDWVLENAAHSLDIRDAEIALLRHRLVERERADRERLGLQPPEPGTADPAAGQSGWVSPEPEPAVVPAADAGQAAEPAQPVDAAEKVPEVSGPTTDPIRVVRPVDAPQPTLNGGPVDPKAAAAAAAAPAAEPDAAEPDAAEPASTVQVPVVVGSAPSPHTSPAPAGPAKPPAAPVNHTVVARPVPAPEPERRTMLPATAVIGQVKPRAGGPRHLRVDDEDE